MLGGLAAILVEELQRGSGLVDPDDDPLQTDRRDERRQTPGQAIIDLRPGELSDERLA